MLVFVYGTLKEGYSNNRLLEGCKKLGGGFTIDRFSMVDSGFPVVVDDRVDKHPVTGEVWDIGSDMDILESLDQLEAEGFMYDRREIPIYLMAKKPRRVICSAYIGCSRAWAHKPHSNDKFLRNGKLTWGNEVLVDE